jgi:hypothetical protein
MTSFADSKVTSRDASIWILNEIKDEIRIPVSESRDCHGLILIYDTDTSMDYSETKERRCL